MVHVQPRQRCMKCEKRDALSPHAYCGGINLCLENAGPGASNLDSGIVPMLVHNEGFRQAAVSCSEGPPLEDPPDEDEEAALAGCTSPKGKLSERELVELRRLVEKDVRFGKTLETTCNAMYELMAVGNPAPVLALLADLVWRSLRIGWEVEQTKGGMSKAQLRARVAHLEGELARVGVDFESSRSAYLRELSALRDQVRRLDGKLATDISDLVYGEEPVMFYEPLRYLQEDVRRHVAEVVEEKMKLLLMRLQGQDFCTDRPKPGPEPDEADSVMSDDALARAEDRNQQLEELLAKVRAQRQAAAARYEAELSALLEPAKREWEALAELAAQRGCRPPLPPPPSVVGDVDGESLQMPGCSADRTRSFHFSGRRPSLEGGSKPFSKNASSFMEDLMRAESELRQSLLDDVEREQSVAAAASAAMSSMSATRPSVDQDSARPPSEFDKVLFEPPSAARPALDRPSACTSISESAFAESDRTQLLEQQLAELRQELQRHSGALSAERAEAAAQRVTEQEELRRSRAEIQRLRAETRRLEAIIEELTAEVDAPKPRVREEPLNWRRPTQKVFDRLFQDAIDRNERRRSMQEAAQQAAAEEPAAALGWSDFINDSTLGTLARNSLELSNLEPSASSRRSEAATSPCAAQRQDAEASEGEGGLTACTSVSECSAEPCGDDLRAVAARLADAVHGSSQPSRRASASSAGSGPAGHRPPPVPPTSPLAAAADAEAPQQAATVAQASPSSRASGALQQPPAAVHASRPSRSSPGSPQQVAQVHTRVEPQATLGARISEAQAAAIASPGLRIHSYVAEAPEDRAPDPGGRSASPSSRTHADRGHALLAEQPEHGLVPVGHAAASELQRLPVAAKLALSRRPASATARPSRPASATSVPSRPPQPRAGGRDEQALALPVGPRASLPALSRAARPSSCGRSRAPEAVASASGAPQPSEALVRSASSDAEASAASLLGRRAYSAADLHRGRAARPQSAQLPSGRQRRATASRA